MKRTFSIAFINNDICFKKECKLLTSNNSIFCDKHNKTKCLFNNCDNNSIIGKKVCDKHLICCLLYNCNNNRFLDSKYCINHIRYFSLKIKQKYQNIMFKELINIIKF